MQLSSRKPRVRDIPGIPPEVDIPGASLRLFKDGHVFHFLRGNEEEQLNMLRGGQDRVILGEIRAEAKRLLEAYKNYSGIKQIVENDSIYLTHPGKDPESVMEDILAEEPDESFCFLNEGRLREKMGILRRHFMPESEIRRIIYAIKANSRSRILEILTEEGIDGFDCASPREIDQVLCVNPTAQIFFNNPIKTSAAIKNAAAKEVKFFTAQSRNEIAKILSGVWSVRPQGIPETEISVRLETLNEKAKINLSTKYGATLPAAKAMLEFLKHETNVRAGLSIHTGSQNSSPETFESAIALMAGLAREVEGVNSLNVGGGIPVNYHPNEQYDIVEFLERISRAVRNNIKGALNGVKDPKIILELGRAVIADAIDMTIPILSVEERAGRKCVYIHDGVFTSFSDYTIHGWEYRFDAIPRDGRELPAGREKCVVFGRTCDSGDNLGELMIPKGLREGDFLWVKKAGAYLDSQASQFNSFEPPKYVSYNT